MMMMMSDTANQKMTNNKLTKTNRKVQNATTPGQQGSMMGGNGNQLSTTPGLDQMEELDQDQKQRMAAEDKAAWSEINKTKRAA